MLFLPKAARHSSSIPPCSQQCATQDLPLFLPKAAWHSSSIPLCSQHCATQDLPLFLPKAARHSSSIPPLCHGNANGKYLTKINGKSVPVYATHSASEEHNWLTSQPGLCTPQGKNPTAGLRVGPEMGVDTLEREKTSPPPGNWIPHCPAHSLVTLLCYHNLHLWHYFSVLFLNAKDCAMTQTLKSLAHHHGGLESMWDLWQTKWQ
jgi:endogenous inhibitor of DNA gyrase (YacG/DUF329 family)